MKEARKVCPPPHLQSVTGLCLVRERQDVPKMENGLITLCSHSNRSVQGTILLAPRPQFLGGGVLMAQRHLHSALIMVPLVMAPASFIIISRWTL